jgi:ribulose bisphosphate carboxylase small subunit
MLRTSRRYTRILGQKKKEKKNIYDFVLEVKRPEHESDHSPPSSAYI